MGVVRVRLASLMGWENIAEHPPPHSSLKGEKRRKGKKTTTFLEIFSYIRQIKTIQKLAINSLMKVP